MAGVDVGRREQGEEGSAISGRREEGQGAGWNATGAPGGVGGTGREVKGEGRRSRAAGWCEVG